LVAATLRDGYNSLVEASYLSFHTILNASIGGSDSLKSDFLGALTRFGWRRRFNFPMMEQPNGFILVFLIVSVQRISLV